MKPQKIEISHKTIIFTALFLISLALLWQMKSLIITLFICFVFMEALNPAVKKLEKYKIPRPLAILVLYLIIISIISFTIASFVPILIEQTTGLITTLPGYIENTKVFGKTAMDLSSQFSLLEQVPGNITKTAVSVVSNIFSLLIIFFITFYLLLERKKFDKYSFDFFGQKGKDKIIRIINLLEIRLGSWVVAQLFLMTVIGVLSYIGFTILGLKYAVPLALLAGLFEAIPTIGPTITTILASLVALTISPVTALLTVLWGIGIQQLENNFIVPKIMNKTIGLNPIITILLIAIGAKLGGILGAILAIPIYLTVEVILKVLISEKSKEESTKNKDYLKEIYNS